jgi:glutamyl-tRNA reductase
MIRAGIVGMGSWGQNLVRHVQGRSALVQFVAGATRTPAKALEFCGKQGLRMVESYERLLADPAIDAVVLATPEMKEGLRAQGCIAAGGRHRASLLVGLSNTRGLARSSFIPADRP